MWDPEHENNLGGLRSVRMDPSRLGGMVEIRGLAKRPHPDPKQTEKVQKNKKWTKI